MQRALYQAILGFFEAYAWAILRCSHDIGQICTCWSIFTHAMRFQTLWSLMWTHWGILGIVLDLVHAQLVIWVHWSLFMWGIVFGYFGVSLLHIDTLTMGYQYYLYLSSDRHTTHHHHSHRYATQHPHHQRHGFTTIFDPTYECLARTYTWSLPSYYLYECQMCKIVFGYSPHIDTLAMGYQ